MPGVADSAYPNKKKQPTGTPYGDPATHSAAVTQQASDYDAIMKQYQDVARSLASNPSGAGKANFETITPQTTKYKQSQDVTDSLAGLADLARTGGYSESGIQDIRARNISPIRSIYASGKQNLERQRSLSGGYSPNFNAVSASMARDMASKIGDITTKTNADIAQNVATNRISAASPYASAAASANSTQLGADQKNTDIINDAAKYNSSGKYDASKFNAGAGQFTTSAILDAIKGQASLYGTTPALVNTFGNQVNQANQLGQNQQSLNLTKKKVVGDMAGG